ncbi:MAG: N-acetylmuramoyl-L-alanine amidase [Deltaproteobacteria bacterium]|nr:N-acetylmuramoyl-L-alanine amidase [Deltaproteobacteria bacterium]
MSHLKRIVVDAGHGGHDTGARSPQGILEKNINLGVAKALRDLLEREAGIDVIMTRDADYFIPLFGRTQIGNRAEADLFVSIHANGAARQTATGLETYFLSLEATDRQDRAPGGGGKHGGAVRYGFAVCRALRRGRLESDPDRPRLRGKHEGV